MEEVKEYEVDGLIQTMKESGIKGIMKYTDVLVLNRMMERSWIPNINERDKLIKTLKENTDMGYKEITHSGLFSSVSGELSLNSNGSESIF
jgi:hypothetical protein